MTFGMMPRLPWGSPMDMFLASCLSGTFGPRIVHCSFLTGTLGMGRGGHGSGQRLSPSFDLRKLLGGLPVSVFEGLEIMVNPFPHRITNIHPHRPTSMHPSIDPSIAYVIMLTFPEFQGNITRQALYWIYLDYFGTETKLSRNLLIIILIVYPIWIHYMPMVQIKMVIINYHRIYLHKTCNNECSKWSQMIQ